MNKISIAIDGPAGAGKSTIARIVAHKLNFLYVDTGAMYRAVTYSIIQNKIDMNDMDEIQELLNKINIKITDSKVYLNNLDVTKEIRSQEVNKFVSPVSTIPIVRQILINLQRDMVLINSVVMDGRDIGTNVLKNANIKIFLTASVDERAQRRYLEILNNGQSVSYESVKNDIVRRDKIDSERELNPLKKADDAIIVDTTSKSIKVVVEEILNIIKREV